MAEESLTLPCVSTNNLEYHIVTLFEKLDELRRDEKQCGKPQNRFDGNATHRPTMQTEIRTLEFWRAIISECMASFFYVFIVCGAAAGAGAGASLSSVLLATSLATGFAMTTLTHCFAHISGAHVNPTVTLAMAVTRHISPVRAAMFVIAQCGGGIAGTAMLYGVTVPGLRGNLAVTAPKTEDSAIWERFGIEFVLSFIVVFTYFISMDSYRKWFGTSSLTIGAAYSTCSFVSMPYLNPARSLGPAFVLNKWNNHWVYWFGPIVGGIMSGLIYEFIFNPRHYSKCAKDSIDGDDSSIPSDEESYDDLDKPNVPKFHGSNYNTYRSAITGTLAGTNTGVPNYCPSLASASVYSASTNAAKLNRVESLYGGTKSLYCKSPPLTRANLNRSQSVYTKSNCNVNLLPRPGPLVPAQSLYPMRLNQQQTHVQNQNVQNQIQQCTEGIYGIRGASNSSNRSESNYGTNRSENYSHQTSGTNRADNYASRNESARQDNSYGSNTGTNRSDSAYGPSGSSSNRSEVAYGTNVNTSNRSDTEYVTRDSNFNGNRETESQNFRSGNLYEARNQTKPETRNEETKKCNNRPTNGQNGRPDSMYGVVSNQPQNSQPRRIQPNLSIDDTYIHTNLRNGPLLNGGNFTLGSMIAYKPPPHAQPNSANSQNSAFAPRTVDGSETNRPPPAPVTLNPPNHFHQQRPQHSPNTQY